MKLWFDDQLDWVLQNERVTGNWNSRMKTEFSWGPTLWWLPLLDLLRQKWYREDGDVSPMYFTEKHLHDWHWWFHLIYLLLGFTQKWGGQELKQGLKQNLSGQGFQNEQSTKIPFENLWTIERLRFRCLTECHHWPNKENEQGFL